MNEQLQARQALANWPSVCQTGRIEPLGTAGGFSGSRLWRVVTPSGAFCLRRWSSEHPTRERLAWMHSVLAHVARQGFRRIPTPVETLDGSSFVELDGELWELTAWLPGEANYGHPPSAERLSAAMTALAKFHLAAATFPADGERFGPSPTIVQRSAMLDRLLAGGAADLALAISRHGAVWPELAAEAPRWLTAFQRTAPQVRADVARAAMVAVPWQPCLRDVWHDHLLFVGDEVTGLVDYGAMRMDNVAVDVARLLGSLAGDDAKAWARGIESYARARPLSDDERFLARMLDATAALLTAANWFEWVFRQGRRFDDRTAVIERVCAAIERTQQLEIAPHAPFPSGLQPRLGH